jgi:hypothetical protein
MLRRNRAFVLFVIALSVCAAAIYFSHPRAVDRSAITGSTHTLSEHSEVKVSVDSNSRKVAISASPANATTSTLDRFQIVEASAKKAFEGDGHAARIIASALWDCQPMKIMYGDAPDPRTAFLRAENAKKNLPQWAADRDEVQFHSCERFFKEDPFSGLPPRSGGYMSPKFWTSLAYDNKDPVAITEHVSQQMMITMRSPSARHDPALYQAVQPDINQAAESGSPEALFRIGMVLGSGSTGDDTIRASAIQLAACNLGYDCTPKNEFVFGACLSAGSCQEGDLYADRVRRLIGEDGFAKAYAMAQQLETAMGQHDAATIDHLVQITPPQVTSDSTN